MHQDQICTVCINGIVRLRRRYPHSALDSELVDLRVGYAKWIRRASSPSLISTSSVNMMHAVASYSRRDISPCGECCEVDSLASRQPSHISILSSFHSEGYFALRRMLRSGFACLTATEPHLNPLLISFGGISKWS